MTKTVVTQAEELENDTCKKCGEEVKDCYESFCYDCQMKSVIGSNGNMIAYKFVKHEIPPLNTIAKSKPYLYKEKLLHGEKLNRDEKNMLYAMLEGNSYSKTGVPLHGWMFDFSRWLVGYYVEGRYGDIFKTYAPDKMSIRANYHGRLKRITKFVRYSKSLYMGC